MQRIIDLLCDVVDGHRVLKGGGEHVGRGHEALGRHAVPLIGHGHLLILQESGPYRVDTVE